MILETERLQLREFAERDWQAVLAYQNDPRYLRYYPWQSRTEAEVRAFIQVFIEWQAYLRRYKFQWAITMKSNGQLIGNAGIRKESVADHKAEVGYEINPQFWGMGYASEAARAVRDFGFQELGLRRIWANCLAENLASRRVLEKIGMQLEGTLRDNEYFKERYWDTCIYAILVNEIDWANKESQAQPKAGRT
ncbi:MAG: GNAT family N-acetyltransferase [Anaerolineales bacterium]|jgi:ribosomal-protein-alanine N-acetyltransferase